MKVYELIEELSKLDPNLKIVSSHVCCTDLRDDGDGYVDCMTGPGDVTGLTHVDIRDQDKDSTPFVWLEIDESSVSK